MESSPLFGWQLYASWRASGIFNKTPGREHDPLWTDLPVTEQNRWRELARAMSTRGVRRIDLDDYAALEMAAWKATSP